MDPNRLKQLLGVVKATREGAIPYCPHSPWPKQKEFLALESFEVLYGGAAGGGKSDSLLMAALQFADRRSYHALVLRRTYADLALPGAIMDRAKEWLLPQGVKWSEKDKKFTFKSGSTLTFGYLDKADDVYRYQGAEFQGIFFDELTQFPEFSYTYLLSRLRKNVYNDVPLRMRAASNPGGIGHHWVKRRFIDDGAVGSFMPAKLADNPSLDAVEYTKALSLLDATTRKQLLEGIWVNDSSGLVYPHYSASINGWPYVTPALEYYLLGIDYGFVDQCGFTIFGWRDHDPNVYIVSSEKIGQMTPSKAAEHVKRLDENYKFNKIVADVGGLGKGYAEEARSRFHLPIEAAAKQNKRGYIDLFNGDMQRGRVKVNPSCTQLIKEWAELPWNEDHTREVEGFENHAADSCLYGWRAVTAYHNHPIEPPKPADVQLHEEMEAMWKQTEEENRRKKTEDYWLEDPDW